MGAYKKLKWKKTLNEYKFLKEELSLTKSMNRASAIEFQEYYESFLSKKSINLEELNKEHEDEIKEAYGAKEEISGDMPVIEPGATDLVVGHSTAEKPEDVQMTEDEIMIHNLFSKLFKSIAVKIHPDKIDPLKHDYTQRRIMEEDFKLANTALKEKNYFVLIEIAERLKIALPKNYDQQTRWMKSKLTDINLQIDEEKRTYNYIFSEAETDEQKDSVMNQFVQQLFGIIL
tara:strand:+ start:2083 stop:2775 length:693 start_codon:yes stop_codon:yes gene_type:complete